MDKKTYIYFYYQPEYFEKLLKSTLKFAYEHNKENPSKKSEERKKFEKEQRKYLKKNTTGKYYRFYICTLNNKIIGHVWFGQQDSDRSKGFIDELYVRPKYRRQGIATILGKEAIRWIREKKCSAIDVDVKVNNKASIKLCKKIGFYKQQPKWVTLSMDLAN